MVQKFSALPIYIFKLNDKEIFMNNKHPLASKTLWANLVMAIVGFVAVYVPAVKEFISPEKLVVVFSFLNMILRMVTKGKIELS